MGIFDRTEAVLGTVNLEKLKGKKIIVFGCGGVGGYVIEMLSRIGIGYLTIVDFDVVSESNINRQIIANSESVGRFKVDCFKERINLINNQCIVNTIREKLTKENIGSYDLLSYDFVIDCIDMVTSKVALIKYCCSNNIRIISSMGTGNRFGIPQFEICDIYKTKNDGLAKALRGLLKKEGVKKLMVVYSSQESKKQKIIGSVPYYPAACGILISSYVVNELIK